MIELYGLISLFTNALGCVLLLVVVFVVAMCIDKPGKPERFSGGGDNEADTNYKRTDDGWWAGHG